MWILDDDKALLKFKLTTGVDIKRNGFEIYNITVPKEYNSTRLEFPEGLIAIRLHECTWLSNTVKEIVFPKSLCNCSFGYNMYKGMEYVSFGDIFSLGEGSFCRSKLRRVDFDSIQKIGDQCFSDCKELKSFDFSRLTGECLVGMAAFCASGIEDIDTGELTNVSFGESCFQSCNNLKSVHLTNGNTYGKNCFYGCENLSSVIIDETAGLGWYCFHDCKSLTNVIIKDYNNMVRRTGIFKGCDNAVIHVYNCNESPSKEDLEYSYGVPISNIIMHSEKYKDD